MRTYSYSCAGRWFKFWYDPSLRLWTITERDANGNQVGEADYASSRFGVSMVLGARLAEKPKHPSETPEYWDRLAKHERDAAECDRHLRRAVESIEIHERNARDYEARASRLRAHGGEG